jgi:hypothetical protein
MRLQLFAVLVCAAGALAGCREQPTPTNAPVPEPPIPPPPQGISTGGTTDSSAAALPGAVTPGSGSKTVVGNGFSVEVPADWTVLTTTPNLGLSSPNDFKREIPGIPVSISILPAPPPTTPSGLVTGLLEGHRLQDVESETQITVAGREATRLVTTSSSRVDDTSDAVSVSRAIRVYVPLDAGVLILQAIGLDQYVQPLTAQLDAIVASITLK